MEKETLITIENWKRCVADNPIVIEFLYNHRRERTFPGLEIVDTSERESFHF